jgi:hypothetical protein
MLIYWNTCCFNCPFDDQSQTRIRFITTDDALLRKLQGVL